MTVTPQSMHNWPELLSSVEKNEGVYRVNMATLRQLEGRQRAGKHIRVAIQEHLSGMGLGHLPEELPNRQQHTVILYKLGTPASEMVQAIKRGLEDPSPPETAYTLLHRLNTIPDPDEVVHRDEVDATVNKEVGSALEEAAKSVLEMLTQANPALSESDERRQVSAVDGRKAMDLMASLRQSVQEPDKELDEIS